MPQIFVVSESDVEGRTLEGDTALEKVIMGPGTGSQLLEQRVTRYAPGRSLPRGESTRDELLYAVSGSGTLELDGEPHDLQPESGAYVRAGETYVIDNAGPDELLIVSTTVPVEQVYRSPREVIVRFADRPELRADAKRTFRYLVNQDTGCMDATQFVGIVEPCRAPDHSHSYDEVGYIVAGEGFAHIDGESIPLRPDPVFTCHPSRFTASRTRDPASCASSGSFIHRATRLRGHTKTTRN